MKGFFLTTSASVVQNRLLLGSFAGSASRSFPDRKTEQPRRGKGAQPEQRKRRAVRDTLGDESEKSRTHKSANLAHHPPNAKESAPRRRRCHIRTHDLHTPRCHAVAGMNPEESRYETG